MAFENVTKVAWDTWRIQGRIQGADPGDNILSLYLSKIFSVHSLWGPPISSDVTYTSNVCRPLPFFVGGGINPNVSDPWIRHCRRKKFTSAKKSLNFFTIPTISSFIAPGSSLVKEGNLVKRRAGEREDRMSAP